MATVAVDFDGVIHSYRAGWGDGSIYDEPVPGAAEGLAELMTRYAVFVHTSRDPLAVAEWLARLAFDVTLRVPESGFWDERGRLLVTDRKLPAVAYVDDRALRFTSWSQTLQDLALTRPDPRASTATTGRP